MEFAIGPRFTRTRWLATSPQWGEVTKPTTAEIQRGKHEDGGIEARIRRNRRGRRGNAGFRAGSTASTINAGDTALVTIATALVLMMTLPGLALFYAGMVRKKNVLATMAQSLAAVALISILWVAFGYSLAFVGDSPWLGTLDRAFLRGMEMDSVNPPPRPSRKRCSCSTR